LVFINYSLHSCIDRGDEIIFPLFILHSLFGIRLSVIIPFKLLNSDNYTFLYERCIGKWPLSENRRNFIGRC